MHHHICAAFAVFLLAFCGINKAQKYEPNWESLDKRPLPSWYDEGKFGIFMHWGVFSVPSFGNEWFWYNWKAKKNHAYVDFMKNNYPPNFEYADFAPQFTTEFFDANEWADILKSSGARYIVLTSKHHEGYTNWPSANSWNWNSMDVGPHRDLVGELAAAIRNRTSIHFGLYHSMFEWFNPLYLADQQHGYRTQEFVRTKTMPELYDIVNRYKPDVIWSDGEWEASSTYWNSTEFLAWLYNSSPVKDTVVTNDRWGNETRCKHGGFFNCDDKYNPGKLQNHKWENAMTIDSRSWGYRRNARFSDYLTIQKLLKTFVITISCGGNLLANIGPTKEGTISPIFVERLQQMGEWLGVNDEAVYSSRPWSHQNDTINPDVWYTTNNGKVYAFLLSWSPIVNLGAPVPVGSSSSIDLVGGATGLSFTSLKPSGVAVTTPDYPGLGNAKWVLVLRLNGFV